MKYQIQGRNLEMLRVELESEADAIVSEVGKMIYKSPGVTWRMALPGDGIAGKIAGSMRRRLSGETALQCRFAGPGEVGFAASVPGSVTAVSIEPGESIVVQRGGYLAAEPSVRIGIATARAKVNLFGGENLILQRLEGPGLAFLHAAGDFVEFDLQPDEEVSAEIGAMVFYDSTVDYTVRRAGGLGTTLLGGEGIFLAHYTGPGRVTLQTMGLWRRAVQSQK